MGSPLSPIVANIYMEAFEDKALEEFPVRPRMWLRYVDDILLSGSMGRSNWRDSRSISTTRISQFSSPRRRSRKA